MMWIDILAECFKHTNVSDIAVEKLFNRFSGYDEETLKRAVDLYLEDGEYFPTIARFRPYAEKAAHQRMAETTRRADWFTDEDIYAWELARGTMRPLAEIEQNWEEKRGAMRPLRPVSDLGGK